MHVQAAPYEMQLDELQQRQVQLAMTDIVRVNSPSSDEASSKKWAQLTEQQRKVLAPLAAEWDTLRSWQREKMLDIAADYPKMDAKKQKRVQNRLNTWSRMTPYERENARKRFHKFLSLSPEQPQILRDKWAEHQKLPEHLREEMRKQSGEVYYDPELD
jgi:hypothetical protein